MPRPTWKERYCPLCKKESREKIYVRRDGQFIPFGRCCFFCGEIHLDSNGKYQKVSA